MHLKSFAFCEGAQEVHQKPRFLIFRDMSAVIIQRQLAGAVLHASWGIKDASPGRSALVLVVWYMYVVRPYLDWRAREAGDHSRFSWILHENIFFNGNLHAIQVQEDDESKH